MTYYYYLPEYGEHAGDAEKIEVPNAATLPQIAERAGSDYHYHRSGLDAEWPLTVVILDCGADLELGRFMVDRECVPVFHATPAGGA